jgi:hypothetical protein
VGKPHDSEKQTRYQVNPVFPVDAQTTPLSRVARCDLLRYGIPAEELRKLSNDGPGIRQVISFQNQGAESTLAFRLALAEVKTTEQRTDASDRSRQGPAYVDPGELSIESEPVPPGFMVLYSSEQVLHGLPISASGAGAAPVCKIGGNA